MRLESGIWLACLSGACTLGAGDSTRMETSRPRMRDLMESINEIPVHVNTVESTAQQTVRGFCIGGTSRDIMR